MMQVNYFAPFFLSVGLVGHMNPNSRILNVAGGAYKHGTCLCKNLFDPLMVVLNRARVAFETAVGLRQNN